MVSVFVKKLHSGRKNSLLIKASGPTGCWLCGRIHFGFSNTCSLAHKTTGRPKTQTSRSTLVEMKLQPFAFLAQSRHWAPTSKAHFIR
jgi:hypothetical protein